MYPSKKHKPAGLETHARTHPYRLAHTHNTLHNRNGKDVCVRRQRLWFAVSARRKLKRSDDTRNTQINKLTKEEEKVERGREKKVQTINWAVGEVWGTLYSALANSGITFTLNSSSTGSISTGDHWWQLLVSYFFPFERGSSVDTTEHWACFEALKNANSLEAFQT